MTPSSATERRPDEYPIAVFEVVLNNVGDRLIEWLSWVTVRTNLHVSGLMPEYDEDLGSLVTIRLEWDHMVAKGFLDIDTLDEKVASALHVLQMGAMLDANYSRKFPESIPRLGIQSLRTVIKGVSSWAV